jgi:hypothetical protein
MWAPCDVGGSGVNFPHHLTRRLVVRIDELFRGAIARILGQVLLYCPMCQELLTDPYGVNEDFGTICCPEGTIGLSPEGFNPGFQPGGALSKTICPEGARDQGATDGCITRAIWSPSGLFAGEIRFPGLKPWAESYIPFGATKNVSPAALSCCRMNVSRSSAVHRLFAWRELTSGRRFGFKLVLRIDARSLERNHQERDVSDQLLQRLIERVKPASVTLTRTMHQ